MRTDPRPARRLPSLLPRRSQALYLAEQAQRFPLPRRSLAVCQGSAWVAWLRAWQTARRSPRRAAPGADQGRAGAQPGAADAVAVLPRRGSQAWQPGAQPERFRVLNAVQALSASAVGSTQRTHHDLKAPTYLTGCLRVCSRSLGGLRPGVVQTQQPSRSISVCRHMERIAVAWLHCEPRTPLAEVLHSSKSTDASSASADEKWVSTQRAPLSQSAVVGFVLCIPSCLVR